jgi:hypothetical protein
MKEFKSFLAKNWMLIIFVIAVLVILRKFIRTLYTGLISKGYLKPSSGNKYEEIAYLQHQAMGKPLIGTDESLLFTSGISVFWI